jgi:RNA polymerase sigma-70 factor (ECF subfamily)
MGFTVDPHLIRDAQADAAALEALLVALWPEAYRVAFGVLHDRGLAEDAAQEACASVALRLSALRSNDAFYGWMYRIVVRHATASAKRSKKIVELGSSAEHRGGAALLRRLEQRRDRGRAARPSADDPVPLDARTPLPSSSARRHRFHDVREFGGLPQCSMMRASLPAYATVS